MTLYDFLVLCDPDDWIIVQNYYDGKISKFDAGALSRRRIFRITAGLNVIKVQLCRG